jgi:hypothetical protein
MFEVNVKLQTSNFKPSGAEDRARTGHLKLGRLPLYQMSYFRLYKFGNVRMGKCGNSQIP